MENLTTKVTKIKNRYHCRLFEKEKVINEVACAKKQDISFCISHMMRWYDKLGGSSLMASASRKRNALRPKMPIGKIWYY